MRGFLIDPEVRTITRINFSGDERTMVAMLGGDHILEAIPQSYGRSLGPGNDAATTVAATSRRPGFCSTSIRCRGGRWCSGPPRMAMIATPASALMS